MASPSAASRTARYWSGGNLANSHTMIATGNGDFQQWDEISLHGNVGWPSLTLLQVIGKVRSLRRTRSLDHDTVFVGAGKAGHPVKMRGIRGISSVGRALEWHSRGQGFEPPILHLDTKETLGNNGFLGVF